MKHNLFTILFSIAGIGMINAETRYEPPHPVKIMFHVDKLPIDKGMRQNISRNLTLLAKREHDGKAEEHRLTAQLLMLAMRLDSKNTPAIELNNQLSNGGELPKSDEQTRANALLVLRRASEQLSKTHRQSEARILEAYLQDVLVALDKSDPLAVRHEEHIKRWEGIVPNVDKQSVIAMPDIIRENRDSPDDKDDMLDQPDSGTENEPEDVGKSQEYASWKMHNSSVKIPLIFFTMIDEHVEYSEKLADMNVQIFPRVKLDSNLMLELKPWADEEQIEEFKNNINPMMKSQFEKYESVKVEITTDERLSHRSLNRMLFPLCLQLKASQKNIQIKPGLFTLGDLSGDKITRNNDFWHLLKYLRKEKGRGQRLFIPVEAGADLKQLVALEEEDFFVRNEVLLVSNIDEAVDLLGESKNPDINLAAAEFAKIQEMIGEKSIGPFAVNSKIRAQLEGILAKNPNHFSAKMILLRGNVSRAKKIDSYFVADELSVLLNNVSYLNEREENDLSEHHMDEMAKEINKVVKELDPLIDSKDRKLPTYLTEVATSLETIARAKFKQRQDENDGKRESKALKKTISDNFADFKVKYKEAKTQLDAVLSVLPKVD
jgi:chorismate mutase